MTSKYIISATLVAILGLVCTVSTQDIDYTLLYGALCFSPFLILIVIFYFRFNRIRVKLNFLDRPNIFFELVYGFVFYLVLCMLLPMLVFMLTNRDHYEQKVYNPSVSDVILQMFPVFLIMSAFLSVFSSIIIVWAIKSYERLIIVTILYIVAVPVIYNVAQSTKEYYTAKQEADTIADNIKEGRYEWHGSMSNPAAFPVQLYEGSFFFPKEEKYVFKFGESWPVNHNAKWGEEGKDTSTEIRSIPNAIDITWYSFTENVFYRLNSPINYKKLRMLFSRPYTDKRRTEIFEEHFDTIIMGFAPGGLVVIWAAGTGPRQVEIGRYQARKVTIDAPVPDGEELKFDDLFNLKWRKEVLTDSTIIPLKIQGLLGKKPIPYGYWDKLGTSYNWRPTFVISPEIKVHNADFKFYNAERFVFFDKSLQNNAYEKRGIPENVYISWYDEIGNSYAVDFEFNEEKTFKKFDTFFNLHNNTSADIEFNINQKSQKATASLKNGEDQILLLETKIIVYKKDF